MIFNYNSLESGMEMSSHVSVSPEAAKWKISGRDTAGNIRHDSWGILRQGWHWTCDECAPSPVAAVTRSLTLLVCLPWNCHGVTSNPSLYVWFRIWSDDAEQDISWLNTESMETQYRLQPVWLTEIPMMWKPLSLEISKKKNNTQTELRSTSY